MDLRTDLFSSSPRDAAIDALHAATAIYTCEPVVDQLLDHVRWPSGDRTLVDTSCGDGAFLRRALARLLTRQPGISDADLLHRISGWEIHPYAAEQARLRVAEVLGDHGYSPQHAARLAHFMVTCSDFLTAGPRAPSYDVVVGNPPYLRFCNVPEPLRCEYERVLPDYAQADLLHSFLDRCARVLRPGGELACITADRWLLNSSAARLREAIGRAFRLAHLERVDVASAFYRPKQRRAGSPPRVHPCAVVLSADRGLAITQDPIYPGEGSRAPKTPGPSLGDVARVRIAPWLGTPGIFLVDAATAASLPADALVPAVDTDDIRGGVLTEPTRRAILTRPDIPPSQVVLDHLARTMHRMCARGRRTSPWLPPEPFHNFDLTEASLLVPRISKSLRPVMVPPGLLPVNHNISIVRAGDCTLEEIALRLSSPEAEAWLSATAAPLENGYRSVTTRLLRSLPM